MHDERKDRVKDFKGYVEGFKGYDPCMMKARLASVADASVRVDACTTCHFSTELS